MSGGFMMKPWSVRFCIAVIAGWSLIGDKVSAVGTWTALTHVPSSSVNTMLLLPDGTVICADGSRSWYRLTPDINGSYANGTWTTLPTMVDTRLYYASQVLTNGNVFIAGAEYGTGSSSAEVYDFLFNAWSFCPGSGQFFYDNISETLPNGNVLVSPVGPSPSGGTIIYNVASGTWTTGGKLFRGSYQDEASWVKLPDGSILTVDPFGTNVERYIPSLNQWVNDTSVPVPLYDPYGSELGPAFLLPNGNAIFFGSVSNTAIYTPSGNTSPGTWVAGPNYPNGQGMPDAPGAMMVSGTILLSTSPVPTSANHFPSPTSFYEYDYTAGVNGAFTQVNAPGGGLTLSMSTYPGRMLALPNGQVLYGTGGNQLYVYQPDGAPLAQGQPTITSVSTNVDGSYHLTGTLLTGISEGAAYGDDAQMDSNYPLVRMTNSLGQVYYARTFNWSSTGVMDSNPAMTTDFVVPTNFQTGTYDLVVVANGNSSTSVPFDYAPDGLHVSPTGGVLMTGPTNGPFSPTTQTYTLLNNSGSTLDWAAGSTASWLTISSVSGSLATGTSTNVVVTLTNAAGFAPGTSNATVTFSNLVSGMNQNVPYRLVVNPLIKNGGFETGSFGYWTMGGNSGSSTVRNNGLYRHSGFYGAELGETNVLGTLSQTVRTTVGANYALSFWLGNPNGLATNNQFSVSWNGVTIYSVTNLPVSPFSNYTLLVSATGISTALQFSYRNNTGLFGLDDISLTPEFLQVTPAAMLVSTGYVGGPFSGFTQGYTLTNQGVGALNWSVGNTSSWLNVSVNGGALGGGQATNVGVSLSAGASVLPAGNYTNTLRFTNLGNNDVQSRQVALLLQALPPPNFQSVTNTGGVIDLTWSALQGFMYQVQYATNLTQTTWSNLGVPIAATTNIGTTSDLIETDPQRFYRVLLLH
jgi:hypothetical protein